MKSRRCLTEAFTLAEILVVIVIISILASLLLPAVIRAHKAAQVTQARQRVSSLALALDQFYNDFGFYPPTNGPMNPATGEFDGTYAYDKNPSSSPKANEYAYNEALVFCLCNKFTKGTGDETATNDITKWQVTATQRLPRTIGKAAANGGPYLDIKEKDFADADGDGWPEMVDPWDHPYLYIPRSDYLKSDGTYNAGALNFTPVFTTAQRDQIDYSKPDLSLSPLTSEHWKKLNYQLISIGPDGWTPGLATAGSSKPDLKTIDIAGKPYPMNNPAFVGTDDDMSSPIIDKDHGHTSGTADDINNWK
jgi:prepilin-type N-terminal cleavage/methylation domain-containing protein